jgi:hypothetical protein
MEQLSDAQQKVSDMNEQNIDRMKDYTAPMEEFRAKINFDDLPVNFSEAVADASVYIGNKEMKLEIKIQKSDTGAKQGKLNAAITGISTAKGELYAKSELYQGPVTNEKNLEIADLEAKEGYAYYLSSNIGADSSLSDSSLSLRDNPELKPGVDKYSQELLNNIEDARKQKNDSQQRFDKVCEIHGLTYSQVMNIDINKSNLIKILPEKKPEADKKTQEKAQKQAVEQLSKAKQNYIEKHKTNTFGTFGN